MLNLFAPGGLIDKEKLTGSMSVSEIDIETLTKIWGGIVFKNFVLKF